MNKIFKVTFLLTITCFAWLKTVEANTIVPPSPRCWQEGNQYCCRQDASLFPRPPICHDLPSSDSGNTSNSPLPNKTVDVGTVTYIHNDALGSPVAASDANGNGLWTEHYWPYGEKREKSPEASSIDIGYTGHRDDDTTGLTYMGARYYDPIAGRFMGVDPAGFSEDNIFSFNRYAYGNNNPYKYIDPNGKNAVTAFGGLLYETGQLLTGNGFDGAMVLGALADGYNGEGSGFWSSATQDALTFGGGALVGGATKLYRMAQASRTVTKGVGGSIKNVNKIGGKQNCANCAIATDATLAGNPASALNGGRTLVSDVEKFFGKRFGSLTSASRIEAQMLRAGDGARGVVFGSRGSQTGHFFNVVNQKGTIRFLDGQTGGTASLSGFKGFSLLRTN